MIEVVRPPLAIEPLIGHFDLEAMSGPVFCKPLQQAIAIFVAEMRKITDRPSANVERAVFRGSRRLIGGGVQGMRNRNHFSGDIVEQVLACLEKQLGSNEFGLEDRKQSSLVCDRRSRQIDLVADKGEQWDGAARKRLDMRLKINRRVAVGRMEQHDGVDLAQQKRKFVPRISGGNVEQNGVELRGRSERIEPVVEIRQAVGILRVTDEDAHSAAGKCGHGRFLSSCAIRTAARPSPYSSISRRAVKSGPFHNRFQPWVTVSTHSVSPRMVTQGTRWK